MTDKAKATNNANAQKVQKPKSLAKQTVISAKNQRPVSEGYQTVAQRAAISPKAVTPTDLNTLQSSIGMQTVGKLMNQSRAITIQRKPKKIDPITSLTKMVTNQQKYLIQPKLTVGPVNDKYEQEADTVAKQVVQKINSPVPKASTSEGVQRQEDEELQMKPITTIQRLVTSEPPIKPLPAIQRQEEEELQMKTAGADGGKVSSTIESQIQAARGSGQPLAAHIKAPMEQAFNSDFSAIRLHTNSQANQLNNAIQAKAFTTGNDIFFREGAYNPDTSSGQSLLAHELTHTIQQGGAQLKRKGSAAAPLTTQISTNQIAPGSRLQPARGKMGRLLNVGPGAEIFDNTFGTKDDRQKVATPMPAQNAYNQFDVQAVAIQTAKQALRGRKYLPQGATLNGPGQGKAIILFSGSGGSNEDQLEPVARFYVSQGSIVYAINYSGYGESRDKDKRGTEKDDTTLTESGLYNDSRTIYDYVIGDSQLGAGNIVVHGFSLGGAVASHLVKKLAKDGIQLGGLVLHSSIGSEYDAAYDAQIEEGVGHKTAALGASVAAKGAGNFDTKGHLAQLAERDPDLPIHFMSGLLAEGDQLAVEKTGLADIAGLNNVSQHQASGGHLETNKHLVGNQNHLATLLQNGRGRDPGHAAGGQAERAPVRADLSEGLQAATVQFQTAKNLILADVATQMDLDSAGNDKRRDYWLFIQTLTSLLTVDSTVEEMNGMGLLVKNSTKDLMKLNRADDVVGTAPILVQMLAQATAMMRHHSMVKMMQTLVGDGFEP